MRVDEQRSGGWHDVGESFGLLLYSWVGCQASSALQRRGNRFRIIIFPAQLGRPPFHSMRDQTVGLTCAAAELTTYAGCMKDFRTHPPFVTLCCED